MDVISNSITIVVNIITTIPFQKEIFAKILNKYNLKMSTVLTFSDHH